MLKLFIFFCFLVSSNSIGAAAEEGVVDNPVLSIDRPDPVQIQENNKGETVIGTSKTLERNLIYSKDIIKNDSDIVITKGAWNVDDSKVIEGFTTKKITVSKEVRKTDNDVVSHKNRAYIALQQRHYEIAVYYYKEILKNNKNDVYAKLGLATAYQYLGEYDQAKPYYMEVLKVYPTNQQVIVSILSILIDESPYESVFLVTDMANRYTSSPLIQAVASLSHTKVKDFPKAITYIQRAILLDGNNLEYKYNLATLYDLNKDFKKARDSYKNLLKSQDSNIISDFVLPKDKIQARINYIEDKEL